MMDIDSAVHDITIKGSPNFAITAAFFNDHEWMPDIPFDHAQFLNTETISETISESCSKTQPSQYIQAPSQQSPVAQVSLSLHSVFDWNASWSEPVAPSVPSLDLQTPNLSIGHSQGPNTHIFHTAQSGQIHYENFQEHVPAQPPQEETSQSSPLPSGSPRGEEECLSDDSQQAAAAAPGVRPKNKGTKKKPAYWSEEERELFLEGLGLYFPNWQTAITSNGDQVCVGLGPGVAELISIHMGTRSVAQVRSHAQKYFLRKYRELYAGRGSP